METTISAPLSTALHDSTMEAHNQAEHATFISRLMNGEGSADGLVALLRQSLPIYEALEETCRGVAGDPRIAAIVDARLERTASLRADLQAHATVGRVCDVEVPTVASYVEDIRASASDPAALIGHHYVRYLGDLSGGQIVKTMVRRHYALEDGLTFYDFDIPKPKVYKDDYRAALDALPLTDAERDSALATAVRAFDLNHQIFLDLEAAGIR